MKRVVIIGSGNVAEALALALAHTPPPYKLIQVYARNTARARQLAQRSGASWASTPELLAEADLYLMAVSDDQIENLSQQLNFGEGIVAHTAGSVSLEVLSEEISNRGVFYPLQTFTQGRHVSFVQIPLCIEGENSHTYETLYQLAHSLSNRVIQTTQTDRTYLHLAAVFACNFTNHLYAVAQEMLSAQGIDPHVLNPLITETSAKALDADCAARVQTGPARRGDNKTLEKHLKLLAKTPELEILYKQLSQQIWETSKKI